MSLSQDVGVLKVIVQWGDYVFEAGEEPKENERGEGNGPQREEAPKGEDEPKTLEGNGTFAELATCLINGQLA